MKKKNVFWKEEKKTSDKQIYYAYDLSLLSLVQLWNIDLAFLTCYVLEHQYPTMYICWHFLVHPLFFGTQHIFFSGHPPLSLFVHPAVQWVSPHLRALTTQTSFAVEVETYSKHILFFRKAFPLNLKDDMAILFLQALKHHDRLWFMSSCRESVWLWWHLLLLCPSHWCLPSSPFCRWCVNLYLCIFICVCVFVYYAPAIVSNWGCSVCYKDCPGTFGNGLTVVVIHR